MRNNSPQDAYGAGETVLAYLRTILSQPRARESRRIPVENKVKARGGQWRKRLIML